MKLFFQNSFSFKKVLIFGGFGLCRFQHKVGMNSFPMCMNLFLYGTNSFPWGMYSFRSKIPIVFKKFLKKIPNPTNVYVLTASYFISTDTKWWSVYRKMLSGQV